MPGTEVPGTIDGLAIDSADTLHGSLVHRDLHDPIVRVVPVVAGHGPLLRSEHGILVLTELTPDPNRNLSRRRVAVRVEVVPAEPVAPRFDGLRVLLIVPNRRRRRNGGRLHDLHVDTIVAVGIARRPATLVAVRVLVGITITVNVDRIAHAGQITVQDVADPVAQDVVDIGMFSPLSDELVAEIYHWPEARGDREEQDDDATDHRNGVLGLDAILAEILDSGGNQE